LFPDAPGIREVFARAWSRNAQIFFRWAIQWQELLLGSRGALIAKPVLSRPFCTWLLNPRGGEFNGGELNVDIGLGFVSIYWYSRKKTVPR
jgi:hypothetical protein